jgi:hypothetical protein
VVVLHKVGGGLMMLARRLLIHLHANLCMQANSRVTQNSQVLDSDRILRDLIAGSLMMLARRLLIRLHALTKGPGNSSISLVDLFCLK